MSKLWFIAMLLLCRHVEAQDTCRQKYDLPLKTVTVAANMHIAYVEKGNGQPVLFIHGLGGNLSHWLKGVNSLSSTYKCIAVDLPGYGYSDKAIVTDKDHLQFYADVLVSFIQKQKLQKPVLVGHSMGGQVAAIIAMQHPELIAKLVLVAPAGLETFTSEEAKMMTTATPPALFEKQEEAVVRYSFKQNFYNQPADAEQLIQDRLRLRNCADFKLYTEAVSNGIKGMLQHPVKADLGKIKMPVLILFGDNDALIPNKLLHPSLKREDLLQQAAASMPQAKIVIIPEAGHLVQFEKSGKVNQQIKDFIQ